MNLMRLSGMFFLGLCLCVTARAEGEFVDLRAFSAAQNYVYSWDPVAKNVVLEGAGGNFRFHVGSEYYLNNGRLERMQGTAQFLDDSVLAPAAAPVFLRSRVASSVPAAALPQASHFIRKVVLDAGHGGKDTGAVSPNGLREKRVVLEIVRKVKKGLEAAGIEVVMTRSADVFIPLSERAHIANKSGAELFVSIHANASTSRSLDGFEVYTLSEATDDQALAVERAENSVIRFEPTARAALSEDLEAILWDLKETQNRKESIRMASHITDQVSGSVAVAARRQRSANFYVLKWTECPAVLVELAYLSNRADERKLRNAEYKNGIAEAIVRGLLQYKQEFEHTNGFTE